MKRAFIRIEDLKLKREVEDSPNLSFLETTPEYHYGKGSANWNHVSEEDKQKVIEEYGSIWNACVAYAERDKQRLQNYGKTWDMIGIIAQIPVLIPLLRANHYSVQTITSGGLWGIESDSDEAYLKEIENEQVEELIAVLRALNVKVELLEKWLADRRKK